MDNYVLKVWISVNYKLKFVTNTPIITIMQSAKAKGKTQNLILRPHRKIIKAKAIFKKMMMKQQWLLSQSQFLYDPFKSGHVKCIFLESGQFSSKWGKALPQKLFYRHTKKGARCIHIDFEVTEFCFLGFWGCLYQGFGWWVCCKIGSFCFGFSIGE